MLVRNTPASIIYTSGYMKVGSTQAISNDANHSFTAILFNAPSALQLQLTTLKIHLQIGIFLRLRSMPLAAS